MLFLTQRTGASQGKAKSKLGSLFDLCLLFRSVGKLDASEGRRASVVRWRASLLSTAFMAGGRRILSWAVLSWKIASRRA